MARKMKDSGIEWIGEIPEDWKISKSKYFILSNDGGVWGNEPSGDGDDKIVIRSTEQTVDGKWIIEEPAKRDLSGIKYENCRILKNDLLMTKSSGSSLHIGKTTLADDYFDENECYYSNFIQRIRVKNINPKLVWYIFNSNLAREQFVFLQNSTSGIGNINAENINNIFIAIGSDKEQQRIVDFLDEKVSEIDTIIAKTKESIEEYKKYKQAVITEAITKGLDKSVITINTNNIHIPKIPAHWQMKKIKYIFEIKKDIAGKEGYDILSITQKGIKIKDISKNEGQLAQDYSNYQLVDIGDFAMNHMDLLTGWVDVSQYAGVTSPDYRVFRFIDADKYNKEYYLYLMQMCYMDKIFYGLGQGVSNLGRWRLQADKFLNFTIPEPPLEEQQEIAKYLDEKCGEIDALIAKKEAFIEEMENYKKSLIYEYVTGKKEVPS